MNIVLAVAIGGAAGALLRFAAGELVHGRLGREFPYGTLSVNVLGSLCIGLFYVWLVERAALSETWRLALIVGLLGSFTTFSSFSLETLQLVDRGELLAAMVNVLASVVLCLAACGAGLWLARQL